jgi:dihydrofolate reductase
MISFIWAEDQNGLIGANGQLPWHLADDMKYFKRTTMGHPIVSGARTFRSYNRPLPGRENIVVSRQHDFPEGVVVVSSIADLNRLITANPGQNYFVTGGANLFSQLLTQVDRLYRTKIAHSFTGDTYMPTIDYANFKLVSSIDGIVNEQNPYPHVFEVFERN